MGLLRIPGGDQVLDEIDRPIADAKRFVFAPESDIMMPIYSDPDLTDPMPQPVISDANGIFALCYLVNGPCRVVIETDAGAPLGEWPDVTVSSEDSIGIVKAFKSVSELLSDSSLSYDDKPGQQKIAAGQSIAVIPGQHFYNVLDKAETEPHLITAGGMKLEVVPSENGCLASAWGAVYDGFTDNSPALQAMVDAGILDICIDAKGSDRVAMGSPVLIHGSAGLRIRGLTTKAKLVPLTDMAFDSDALFGLGLEHVAEYDGRQCFFMITEYDGENDRPGFAARDYRFSNLATDCLGSHERAISLVSSPHASHIRFHELRLERAKFLYDGWLLSDSGSRHYHIAYQNIRLLECESLASGEYVEGNSHIPQSGDQASAATSMGTSMNLYEVSFEACRKGLKIYGQNYSETGPFSVDNNWPGSYALDVYDSQCAFGAIGIENRLHRIGGVSGGGVCRIRNSTVNIASFTIFGGDADGAASAGFPLTDYDDGSGTVSDSLFVIDNAWVSIGQLYADMDRETGVSQWPVVLKNGAFLRVRLGTDNGLTSTSHFDVRDTSVVHVTRPDGKETWLLGPDLSDYIELQNAVATGADNTTCIASAGLDVLTDLPANVPCRVNQGAAGASDPATYNLPSQAYGGSFYGVIRKQEIAPYAAITYHQTNGKIFEICKGTSWTGWRQTSGALPEVSATDLGNAAHEINTAAEKLSGVMVWDQTNKRQMRASGSTATAAWDVIDGSASVTPS